MDIPVLLVKMAGVILLLWTGRSIYRHVQEKRMAARDGNREVQSISEQVLNNILLYLWLAFMLAFSIGMIFNN